MTTSLNPWGRPSSRANVVRAHQRGRICAHEGCATILSIYNPSKYCSAHTQQTQRRRGEIRPILEVACANCGAPFQTGNPKRKFCSDRCRMAAFARRKRAAQRRDARLAVSAAVRSGPSLEVGDDIA
jgi:predicted nucleic acid-binding Zn ribbon protein